MRWSAQSARPWRVVVVDGYAGLVGGSHVVARDLARAGTSTGAWTTTVVLPSEGPAATWLRGEGVEVRVVPVGDALLAYGGGWRRRLLPAVPALAASWWRHRAVLRAADVAHLNDHRGLLLAGPAAVLARRPVVWHLHNADASGRLGTVLSHLAARSAQAVVVPSRAGAALPSALRTRALVVPNPVQARPALAAGPAAPGPATLVTVARLHPAKGLVDLLEAVRLLRADRVPCELVVVGATSPGDEAHASELRRLAEQVGGASFTGPLADPGPTVASATVYVQPSHTEPFGLAALEASALGVPVVATTAGGLPDVVEDGVTGILVPAREPAALAEALRSLLEDADLRTRMGAAGRRRALQVFSPTAFASGMEQVYVSATGGE